MKISLLMDNPGSWFAQHADRLAAELGERGHVVARVRHAEDLPEGDCAFFLACEKIVPPRLLARHRHNLVIHESDLPRGKGWAPMTWQILEGKNEIPVTLLEAAEAVDSGPIYAQEIVRLEGHELIREIREAVGTAAVALALRFVDGFPQAVGRPQQGEETFYRRRTPGDSELDPSKPLAELFNQLRVADNERYPAFFRHRGKTYVLKVEKADDDRGNPGPR